MYQFALVKMLHNLKENTFHPIFYYESPLPGPIEDQKVLRFKSKGHRTEGFKERPLAVESVSELEKQLKEQGDRVRIEIEEKDDIPWDGEGVPTDMQIRPYHW